MSVPAVWTASDTQLERLARRRRKARRRTLVSGVSTAVVIAVLVTVVLTSPGWDRVQETYFDWGQAQASLPAILRGFGVTVQVFLVAEALILVVALVVAIVRVLPFPGLAPLKLLAVVYTDVSRGTPTLLVVYLVGFGLPALELQGIPGDPFWLAVIALTFSYGGYVSEVFRAGITSVHPSQWAGGRSLGLSYGQTLRLIVVPQGIRRVLPPLVNDFASLQKDTALIAVLGVAEAFQRAQVEQLREFNYTPLVVAAIGYIVLTVPFARLTDHLALRLARRDQGLT
ncbi:MAG: amino acid ABC transporter permease [Nocardioidaceae bacterium]|nr:amino acid ABC transporter permease [Nocardioidaceae bacterium]